MSGASPSMPKISRSRAFMFTVNNFTEDDINGLSTVECKYIVYGKEVGEENTPHLQGYINFENAKTRAQVSNLPGLNRAWLEPRKGTEEEAVKYCKKDGDVYERGERSPGPGARSDIKKALTIAMTLGLSALIATGDPTYQDVKACQAFLPYAEEERDWIPEVVWLWGESGVGKSMRARELAKAHDPTRKPYTKNAGTKWWDGYDGHKVVVIDDIRCDWFKFEELLAILDRFEYRVEYKGGSRQFKPELIIITCIHSWKREFTLAKEPMTQLHRRITRTEEVHKHPLAREIPPMPIFRDEDDGREAENLAANLARYDEAHRSDFKKYGVAGSYSDKYKIYDPTDKDAIAIRANAKAMALGPLKPKKLTDFTRGAAPPAKAGPATLPPPKKYGIDGKPVGIKRKPPPPISVNGINGEKLYEKLKREKLASKAAGLLSPPSSPYDYNAFTKAAESATDQAILRAVHKITDEDAGAAGAALSDLEKTNQK